MGQLPGEEAHLEMMPYRKASSLALQEAQSYRVSAVLMLIFDSPEGPQLVLTERQSYEGKHSGQISFPGGKQELSDESTIITALRETNEEIGLNPPDIHVIGKLTDVYIPVSGFLVHPYLGYHPAKPEFIPDPREVKSVITFPVEHLLKEEIRVLTRIRNHQGLIMKDIPCFMIQEKAVWGATALMLNEFRLLLNRF